MIIAIDAGNHETKVMGAYGPVKFLSDIGEYRERNTDDQKYGDDDMVFEYNGRKGFAGSLAHYESEFGGSIFGDTKAHDDARIRVLLALHRYNATRNVNIIVGQPFARHTNEEKSKIKSMLSGMHTITVNGIEKTFNILRVEVAAEGMSAFLSAPQSGTVRIIDVGSGTVNLATWRDMRKIDRDSTTLTFGANTNKSDDLQAMTRGIATSAFKKWNRQDNVLICGGLAERMLPYIREHFPNANVLHPKVNVTGTVKTVHPIYANVIGYYEIARRVYGGENR